MKKTIAFLAFVPVLWLTSCADMGPNANRGAATGALIGAGAGAVVGHQSGRTLEGAAIGGASGALIGGAYGNARDKEQGWR